jgi:hypothetical protein
MSNPGVVTTKAADADRAEQVSDAWFAASGRRVEPARVRVLKQKKSGVYVLPDGLAPGRSVIAKSGPMVALRAELLFYQEIAPMLPVRTAMLHGALVDDELLWLFLEDVGHEHHDGSPEHVESLTNWLAAVHLVTAGRSWPDFPSVGPERYRQHLRAARSAIVSGTANPTLKVGAVRDLVRVVDLLDRTDEHWAEMERGLSGAPGVLVHGDLVAKNIHVLRDARSLHILPLDWETAGIGVAATDLSTSPHTKVATNPDLDCYLRGAGAIYPGWDLPALERLSAVGTMFRSLAAMDWVSRRLAHEWVDRPLRDLPVFATVLADAAERAEIVGVRYLHG